MDFDAYEGTTALGNEGDADDTSLLSVAGAGIRRVELYQPLDVQSNDGLSFDNLFFTVPEPGGAILVPVGPRPDGGRLRGRSGAL